jgi:hypothetical protein
MFKHIWKPKLLLLAILILGAFLRFYNVDWDQGQHLHPDERFLTMVATAMIVPSTFIDYLNPQVSTLNPANIGHPFYVYGTLPVVITKLFAVAIGADNYMDITILGRVLSGFADVLVILFIYKIVALFEKKNKLHPHIKYWAAFFYAIAVLPIQLSHFFAVDTFLNLFIITSVYFAIRYSFSQNYALLTFAAIFFGLAIGSKISAIYASPLILYFIFKPHIRLWHIQKSNIPNVLYSGILFALVTYIVGRFADPYLFQTGNFLDPRVSSLFLENIAALKSWSTPDAWFPPSVQWVNKLPILFPLSNIVLLGIGIGYTILAAIGIVKIIRNYKAIDLLVILSWALLFFVYQAIQFSTTMRYFLPLYPYLAIFAAIGFYEISKHWSKLIKALVLFPVILWTLFFFSIYMQEHTRNTASQWIYQNIPSGYTLLSEHWDDSLPLGINPPSSKVYTLEQLPVFDPDTPEKWDKMNALLQRGDYLILSSNRGWGSIPTVPDRYPQMTKFYEDLFAGRTTYKKVAEFTSYPSLNYLGISISIPDDLSEEAFTVYDHPRVLIFENTSR